MYKRIFLVLMLSFLLAFAGGCSSVEAQGNNYTMKAPPGVSDGSKFLLFGQGGGKGYTVRNGQVTIPGNVNATSIFGNFELPNGGGYEVPEQLSSLPSGSGWAAIIYAGECQGNQYLCDTTEYYVDSSTYALVVENQDYQSRSSFDVFVEGGYVYLGLPDRLNSISVSGVENRGSFGLSTGRNKNLVHVGQLLQEHDIIGVKPNDGQAQIVSVEETSSEQYSTLVRFPVSTEQCIQFAYEDSTGKIDFLSTVEDAKNTARITVKKGDGPLLVGPDCYEVQ